MKKDVIIACDFPTREETLAFLDRFEGKKPFVKIGMELFYAQGPRIVQELKERGLNDSITHVDFMVGTKDLSIVGTTHDGREIPVFVDGNFAPDF